MILQQTRFSARILPLFRTRPAFPVQQSRHLTTLPTYKADVWNNVSPREDAPLWFLLADIHISDRTVPRLTPFFDYFLQEFEAQKPSQVLVLGDTFDVRRGTDPSHHRIFTNLLERIISAPWAPHAHLLVGNHDMKNRFNRADNSIHPFSIAFGKVSVYSEPTRLLLDGQDTVFIPYHSDEAPVRKYISSTASPDTVAFYHGAVNGAVMNSKAICHDSTISLPKLGKYKRVFLGHFHTHGPIGNPESTSMYVGAPIQSNMGDAGDLEHGFVSYRPRTDSWKLHRNPHAQYFVKIPWGEVEGQVREQVKGKKVRVELDGEVEVETRDINRVRETLYEYGADFVEVRSPQSSRKKQGPVPEVASTVKLGDTIAEMVESFIAASEATTEEDANHTLKQDRKAFFLEFVKPHQRPPPRAGTVFQGDLTTITMHNFRGIKDTTVFSLSDLPRAEVFVINGANGAGKSTLIEAIVWCLFGEFISGVPVEDISNRNALECYVQLDWGNGYKFKRSRKGKTKKAITFQITNPAGEVEEHGHNASTTTKWLQEQLLGMDIGMFKQTVVIGDDAAYLVRSAGERGRTECLDDMFGLEALGQIREALLLRVKELQTEITDLKREQQELEYRIKENQQQWDTRKEEVASDEAREQQLAKQLVPLRAEIGPLQKQRGQFDQIVRTHRKLLAEVDDEKSELAKMMQALSDRHREMRAEENKHEERRAKNEVWEKAQREAREAREKAQREAREAREKAQREAREARERAEWEVRYLEQREEWEREMRARQPLQILLKYLRDIWAQFLELVGYKPLDEASDQPQKSPEEKDLLSSTIEPIVNEEPLVEQEIPHVGQEVAPPEPYDPEAHLRIRSEIESLSEDLSTHQNHFQSLLSRERSIQTDLSIPSSESSRLSQRLIFNEKQISSFEGQLQLIASQKINQAKRLATFSHDAAVLKSALETTTQKLDSREKMQDLTTYWKQQLQDTATTKGAFLTHCRAAYIQHINRLLPNILSSLCLDSEGLLSTQQLLDFKLTSDFKLEPAEGALALTRRSRGQTTRTYLALFLALWVQSRERCAFRPGFVWMDEVVEVVDEAGMEGLRAWLEGYLRSEGGGGGRAFLLTHRDVVGGRVVECRKTRDGGTEYVLRD